MNARKRSSHAAIERRNPRQERSRQKVESILRATEQLLVEQGFANLSTNHVAAEAGISVGTIYQYFPDKMALVSAIQQGLAQRDSESIAQAFGQIAQAPLRESIRVLINTLVELRSENAELRNIVREQVPPGKYPEWLAELDARIETQIAEAIRSKVPNADALDIPAVVFVIMKTVDSVIIAVAQEHPEWIANGTVVAMLESMVLSVLQLGNLHG